MSSLRIFCFLFGLLAACACASPIPRTALVIGNQRYEPAVGALRNTGNDAKAMAEALRGLGFSVIEKHNLTREELLRAMDAFRKTLAGSDIGIFYYAGHGIAIDGSNYLIPIKSGFSPSGADSATLRMLAETHLFNAEQAVADMSAAGAKCNLVILDACRTTCLAGVTRNRGMDGGGLAEMTPPAGSLIAFSTEAGHTSFDGDGRNGLYTEELLKNLVTSGLTIEQVFKRTRAGVLERSEGSQMPAEYSRLVGDDVFLAGDRPVAVAVAIAVATPTPTPTPSNKAEALAEIRNLATAGKAEDCVREIESLAQSDSTDHAFAAPLGAVLDHVKEELKDETGPSTKALAAEKACDLVLGTLPKCLPPGDPDAIVLAAKAHNRRGDALLLLGRADQALAEYNAALPLDPKDAYILYNRGRAELALAQKDAARADFIAASDAKFDQPKARKLARKAIADMEQR
jgi:tetratricopeptide (TPR) repeat protein